MKKNHYLIFAFVMCLFPLSSLFGQYEDILSQKSFEGLTDDDTISQVAYELGFNYRFSNSDSAEIYLDLAAEYALKSKNHPHYLKIKHIHATTLGIKGDFDQAIKVIEEAYQYALDNDLPKFESIYYYRKGRYLASSDKYDSAIHYLKLHKDMKVSNEHASTLELAKIYSLLKDRTTAKQYYEEALRILRIKKSPIDYLYVLTRVIDNYEGWGLISEASDLKEEYLKYKLERNGEGFVDQVKMHNYVVTPFSDFKELEKSIIEALPIHKNNKNWLVYAEASHNLASKYMERGETNKALPLLKDGKIAADQFGHNGWIYNYEITLYEAYNNLKQSSNALYHLENAFELKDSLLTAERIKSTNELEVKYQTEKKETEFALLKTEDELKSLQLSKAKRDNLLFGGIAVVSIILLSLLGFLFLQNKRKSSELGAKNKIIEKALEDKDILLREIHHRVKNNLQVVSSLLNLQSNYISDDVALQAINEGKNRVSSMALIHQNLYQEENLTGINCKEYFEELIENLFDSYNIQEESILLEKDVSNLNLDVETMVPLGLIVNELISNALKHAFTENNGSGKINFTLKENNGILILKIEDNGKGMKPETFLNSKSFGNKLIQAFKQKLGATIEIENKNGTHITLTINKFKIAA